MFVKSIFANPWLAKLGRSAALLLFAWMITAYTASAINAPQQQPAAQPATYQIWA